MIVHIETGNMKWLVDSQGSDSLFQQQKHQQGTSSMSAYHAVFFWQDTCDNLQGATRNNTAKFNTHLYCFIIDWQPAFSRLQWHDNE